MCPTVQNQTKTTETVESANSSQQTSLFEKDSKRKITFDVGRKLKYASGSGTVGKENSQALKSHHNLNHISVLPLRKYRIQPKLLIGSPDDKYEKEANTFADRMVNLTSIKSQDEHISQSNIQGNFGISQLNNNCISGIIQRESKTDEPEESRTQVEEEDSDRLMMKSKDGKMLSSNSQEELNNTIHEKLERKSSEGVPLNNRIRSFFEFSLNQDLKNVRIHTGDQASDLARSLNAHAFTYRNNIYFGRNEYKPYSVQGYHLLAHELTHTIQQGSYNSGVRTKLIQRAQIGHINRPSGRVPYFEYEIDTQIPDFDALSVYYGIAKTDIEAQNSGVSVTSGARVRVPAVSAPVAMTGSFGGSGQQNIVTGSNIHIRWAADTASNKLGQLNNGNTVPEVFSAINGTYSSAFIDTNQLANKADGIINELRHLNLVSGPSSLGNYVLGYVPTANITQRTTNAENALSKALGELALGVVENPACTNRGTRVDVYTGVRGSDPVISGNRVRSGVCGRAWCAYFVRWCLNEAGISNTVSGAAVSVKRWGRSNGWYHLVSAIRPMRGDIFFKQPSGGNSHPCDTNPCVSRGPGSGHVGFVTGMSGSNVQTVEGNINVSSSNDGIRTYTRPLSDLEGVVRIP